jgi:hypothetical protein
MTHETFFTVVHPFITVLLMWVAFLIPALYFHSLFGVGVGAIGATLIFVAAWFHFDYGYLRPRFPMLYPKKK